MGTAGQNITSTSRYMVAQSTFDIMEKTLEWRHIAPVAPDQLHSYPFADADPFLLETCPHVYFAGNQEDFQTRLVTGAVRRLYVLIAH